MLVYIGSDESGYETKKELKSFLESSNTQVIDLGVFDIEEIADYPDIAREVAEKIAENPEARGVLIDQTGIGMMIAANKVPSIRATVATTEEMAEIARGCNDANILCLGTKLNDLLMMKSILQKFVNTPFSNEGKDKRCLAKLEPNTNNG